MNKFVCALIPLLFAVVSARLDNDVQEENVNKYVLHNECLRGLQNQVHAELHASLVYQQMAAHFNNNKIARKGFAKFFLENSEEERGHAQKIIDYINVRGGVVSALNVDMPHYTQWTSAKSALEAALELEYQVNNQLHLLHKKADHDCKDPQLMDFIEGTFLNEQVESIDNIQRIITQLNGMDQGMGEYWVNKDLQ